MSSTFLSWAMSQPWLLYPVVAEEAVRVLAARARGERVDQDTIHRIVARREQRRARVVADRAALVEDGAHVIVLDGEPDEELITSLSRDTGVVLPAQPPRGMSRNPADDRGYTIAEGTGVAVVPVDGILCKYADQINGMSQPQGMTPLDIRDAILRAGNDPRVKAVVLDIDSPGGTVAGGEDLVEAVRDFKQHARTPQGSGGGKAKPIVAYGHDLCCSGALLLATQCDQFYVSANATVGSIGVVAVYRDRSSLEAAKGVKVHVIASGPYKGAGTDGAPLTDAHLAKFQERINDLAAWFVTRVAEGRDMAPEDVKKLATGETWVGKMAAELGLCDGAIGYTELIRGLERET